MRQPTTYVRLLATLAIAGGGFQGRRSGKSGRRARSDLREAGAHHHGRTGQADHAGVSALEVNDYAPGHYTGPLTPSPPHADMNARKAVVVFWKDHPQRFVFSHEASYCPFLELPNGAAMCNQFFEGNLGEAELFNNMGRKEKNSFVDVIQSGPQRVWVRWTYFAVNMSDDTQPRLRGTEDYFAYPNGLVLRRMTYESLMPKRCRRLQHAARRAVRRGSGRQDRQGPVPA